MSEHEEFYTPEQVDEQIDAFLQERSRSTRDQRLASDLRSMSARPDDSSSLHHVWQKLMQDKSETRQQGSIIPLADRHLKHQERSVPMDKPMKRSTPMQLTVRVFSTLAAVVVVVFLVGSLLVLLNANHQQPADTTTAGSHTVSEPKTPPAGQVIFRSKPFPALGPVAWSPDGKRAALVVTAAGDANKLNVESVDALTGQHTLTYTTVDGVNVFIAWSPDGSQLAVTEGTQLAVFDAKTAKQLHTFSTPSVALNSNHTPSLVAIQVTTPLGSLVKLSGGTAPGFNGVTWSPDGKFLAAISNGHQNEVSVWDTTTGSVFKTLTGFGSLDASSFLRSLIWSPDRHQLGLIAGSVSSASDEVQIVDTTSWQVTQHYPNTDEFSWGPDGKQLALVDSDKNNPGKDIRIVDAQSGQTVKIFAERVQRGINIYGIYWSPDGTHIALDTLEIKTTATAMNATVGLVELWSVADGKLLSKFDQDAISYASSWSPDSKYILTVVMDDHTANNIHAYVIWKA